MSQPPGAKAAGGWWNDGDPPSVSDSGGLVLDVGRRLV